MKTGYAILFCLGCIGVTVGMVFGPTSATGGAIGIGIILLMMTVGFIIIRREDAEGS